MKKSHKGCCAVFYNHVTGEFDCDEGMTLKEAHNEPFNLLRPSFPCVIMTGYAFFILNTSLKTVMCIYYYRQGRRAYFSPRLLMIAFANSSSVSLCLTTLSR